MSSFKVLMSQLINLSVMMGQGELDQGMEGQVRTQQDRLGQGEKDQDMVG